MAQPESANDARSLLMHAGDSVLLADTVRLEGTQEHEVMLPGSHLDTSGAFVLERGTRNRVRLEITVAGSQVLEISDGANRWTYSAALHTHTRAPQPQGASSDPVGLLKYSRDPAAFHDAKVEREEVVKTAQGDVPCFVVHAAYDAVPGIAGATNVTRTVWIARSGNLILRDIWDYSTSTANGIAPGTGRITTVYTKMESGMPLADDRFVFTPPAGSRELTMGDPLAAAGSPSRRSSAPKVPAVELLRSVPPQYSAEARAAGLQGIVSLYVIVGNDGRPVEVNLMQGLGLGLDEQAKEAVKQWQYNPATGDSEREVGEVDVPFHLDSPAPWSVAGEAYTVTVPPRRKVKQVIRPVPTQYAAPPAEACQSDAEVELTAVIGADGVPREVTAVRGDTGPVADAAIKAVEAWHFDAATLDGKPAEASAEIDLECRPAGALPESQRTTPPTYRVGGGVRPPVLIHKIEPEYSEPARKNKVQGTVVLYVQISPAGKATNIRVVRSLSDGLNQQAVEAVKRWRFRPGAKDGRGVTVEATIEVNFRLL